MLGAAIVWAVLFVLGCNSENQYKWASFFFDGVPVPGSKPAVVGEQAGGAGADGGSRHVSGPVETAHRGGSVHEPYSNGQCNQCHESTGGPNMKDGMPATCFGCHVNFLAAAKVVHGAAAQGQCLECHHPHDSPNEKLLVRLGRGMCLQCHDDPVAKRKPVAEPEITDFLGPLPKLAPPLENKVKHPPAQGDCLACHSPHASDQKGLLLKPLAATCFDCHDDTVHAVKHQHEPAVNGECMSCHAAHASPFKGLTLQTGPALCLECHDDPLAKGKVKHSPVEGGCIDCHNPHGSDHKGLLKKSMAETCFECHDDFLKGAKFKHDPAANGECMACHAPHASDNAGLLIKSGSKLCYECHEEADVKKVKVHERFPDRECTSCHDPHGSKEEKFLKSGVLKLINAPDGGAHARR